MKYLRPTGSTGISVLRSFSRITLLAATATGSVLGLKHPGFARQAYEAYFEYTTDSSGHDYPHNGTPSWGDDDNLTNGVAHDHDNWYFTSLGSDAFGFPNGSWVLWRIPVSE